MNARTDRFADRAHNDGWNERSSAGESKQPTLTFDVLRSEAFDGFVTFEQLRDDASAVPSNGGVYVVVRPATQAPTFLAESCGGHFKGRNPTKPVAVLESEWVPEAEVLYIGKGDDLQRRVKQYAGFGVGRPIGHWGGRYIWQLSDSDELLVAWKVCTKDQTAASLEAQLANRFKQGYGRLPFANIADPCAGPLAASVSDGGERLTCQFRQLAREAIAGMWVIADLHEQRILEEGFRTCEEAEARIWEMLADNPTFVDGVLLAVDDQWIEWMEMWIDRDDKLVCARCERKSSRDGRGWRVDTYPRGECARPLPACWRHDQSAGERRSSFTQSEITKLRRRAVEMEGAEPQDRWMILASMTGIGFNVSDYLCDPRGFTQSALDELIERGMINTTD